MISSKRISSSSRIHLLDGVLIDRIAAGEVIEAPASIVKELIENSIDASADAIQIFTQGGGLDEIIVEDNGSGIDYDDLPLSLSRYATSKIVSLDDLESILSYGFRGEALASIASVSRLELFSMKRGGSSGGVVESRGGELLRHEPAPGVPGSVIHVTDLFYSTPARKKFVKSERTENVRIYGVILKYAISRPNIRFRYVRDGKEILLLDRVGDVRDRIEQVFGKRVRDSLIEVQNRTGNITLSGYVSSPAVCRSSREGQFLYVNERPVELKSVSFLVRKGYGEGLAHGSHPYYFLFVEGDPSRIDVNVHPAKREVRLIDEPLLNAMVVHSVEDAVHSRSPFSDYANITQRSDSQDSHTGSGRFDFLTDSDHFVSRKISSPISEGISDVKAPIRRVVPERHFGLFFNTYILTEDAEALYIIDQHTAHERVNFEYIKSKIRDGVRSQELLAPILITLLPDEMVSFIENLDQFGHFGFQGEEFAQNQIVLRKVPDFVEPGEEEEYFRDLLQRVIDGASPESIFDELAAMRACKASVKKNDHMSDQVLTDILRDLNRCEEPLRCPHGRPTVVKIVKEDIDRMFLRNSKGQV